MNGQKLTGKVKRIFKVRQIPVRGAGKTAGRVFCLWVEASFFLDFLGIF
jgi:hypothetical protein